jgi:hypothetical protein
MNQTFSILTRIPRPLYPTVIVNVEAPDATTAYRLVALRNPGSTIIGIMPNRGTA